MPNTQLRMPPLADPNFEAFTLLYPYTNADRTYEVTSPTGLQDMPPSAELRTEQSTAPVTQDQHGGSRVTNAVVGFAAGQSLSPDECKLQDNLPERAEYGAAVETLCSAPLCCLPC